MRSSPTAALVLVAAVVGGVAVLVTAKAAGLLHGTTTTEVIDVPAPAGGASAPVVVAKPLAGNGFEPAQIYRRRAPGVVTIYAGFPGGAGGQGSGFVVSPTGSVLTSAHVVTTAGLQNGGAIEPARQVYVQFSDEDRAPARIVGYDVFDDVAVLHVDPKLHALDPLPLGDSSRVVVGEPVAAIGSPFGDTGSLSVGVVSAIRRTLPSITKYSIYDAIQTDAPINHGNSGGPLLDARGRVIGINAQITSSGGPDSGSEGVGFAVPINAAKRSLLQLLATGKVAYAYVGINDGGPDAVDRPAVSAWRPPGARWSARSSPGVAPRPPASRPATGRSRSRDSACRSAVMRSWRSTERRSRERRTSCGLLQVGSLPGQTARFTVVRGQERRTVVREARRAPAGGLGTPGSGNPPDGRENSQQISAEFRGLSVRYARKRLRMTMNSSNGHGETQAIRLTIPAKPEFITLGRLALTGIARLRGEAMSQETLGDLKLALTEACTNSVRHAYADGDGLVEIVYELHPDRLVVEVRDQGEGFEPAAPRSWRSTATSSPKAASASRSSRRSPTSSSSAKERRAARACASSSCSPRRRSVAQRRQLIVVSNRGPVTYERD